MFRTSALAAILLPRIRATSTFDKQNALAISPAAAVKDLLTLGFGTIHNAAFKVSQNSVYSRGLLGRKPRCLTKLKLARASGSGGPLADEWILKLPDKKKPLYSHSLPCIEAWLRSLGFYQSKEDRAVWFTEKPDWHAQLSMDITDLHIRYLKNGPGKLERDVERKFSYALSREDLENAILGGP